MVSVVIPVYNGEKYIRTIIGCFEKQKYKQFELIFVNDGSKDNSLVELDKIKNISELNIKIFSQPNSGVSVARNTGIKNAEGDLICFCDVDDEVTETYIYDMASAIKIYNVDLVICKHKLIKMNGENEKTTKFSAAGHKTQVVVKDSTACLKDFLYGRVVSGCCTIMVKKDVLIGNNLYFANGYKYSEDLHMLWRIIACSKEICYINKCLYIYKLQHKSATSLFNEERMHGYELMKNLESFFEQRNPSFASEYKKYGAAKLMWSITWQAAVNMNKKEFISFIGKNKAKTEIKKLIFFKNFKVKFSSVVFCISPSIFKASSLLGKKYIH